MARNMDESENRTMENGAKREKRFYPDYLVEVLVVMFVALEASLVLAFLYPPTTGREIDFSVQYQPRPEWYFLWLYRFVRYFPGDTAFIGTVVIPVAAVLLFMFIPFLDRGKYGRLRATAAALVLLSTFLLFTLISALSQ